MAETEEGKGGIAQERAENTEGIAIGLQEADTAKAGAQGKAGKNAHLAEDTAGKEGARGMNGAPLAEENAEDIMTGLPAEDTAKGAARGKAGSAEGITIALRAEASMGKEGAKAENGARLAQENAGIMVTGLGLRAEDTAGTGAAGAHLAGRNAHSAAGNAAGAASDSGTRRGRTLEASARVLPKGKKAGEGLTAQNS